MELQQLMLLINLSQVASAWKVANYSLNCLDNANFMHSCDSKGSWFLLLVLIRWMVWLLEFNITFELMVSINLQGQWWSLSVCKISLNAFITQDLADLLNETPIFWKVWTLPLASAVLSLEYLLSLYYLVCGGFSSLQLQTVVMSVDSLKLLRDPVAQRLQAFCADDVGSTNSLNGKDKRASLLLNPFLGPQD